MEALDGIVKHLVCQDSMVIYVQRHVSVKLTCVINKVAVNHHRLRQVRVPLAFIMPCICSFMRKNSNSN